MATKAQKIRRIDEYFRETDYFDNVPFVPFANDLVDVCMNHTGVNNLWISSGATVVEMEGGGKNVMGCDYGALHCNVPVTPERVQLMIRAFKEGRAPMNGVGLTQITWFPYVQKAQLLGGAHVMRNQMLVGFNVLNDLLNGWPYRTAIEAYNDGNPSWNNPANPYDVKFAALQQKWIERLS